MGDGLQITFWGTRGSMAAPFSDRMSYGGNTSCMSAEWEEQMAVFDGGTGLMALGKRLGEEANLGTRRRDQPIHIFIGHLHLDHIVGIPLFPCLFWNGARLHFYGPGEEKGAFRKKLRTMMGHPYWPVSIDQVPARITWHDTVDGDVWELPRGARVRVMKSSHPDGCVLFRLEREGQSVVYGLDCELGGAGTDFWNRYREFAKNCSLLVFDSPYGEEEYPSYRGFGHSYWQQGIRMAGECRAGRLVISHHDWGRTDGELRAMEQEAVSFGKSRNVDTVFAREGACLFLESFKRDGDGGEAG